MALVKSVNVTKPGGRGLHGSTYDGETYTPKTLENGWIAVTDREEPWATLGHSLTGSMAYGKKGTKRLETFTAADALAATGMDMTIEKRPLSLDGVGTLDDVFATGYFNADGEWVTMGYVGDKYKVVQPAEGFGFIDHLVHSHGGAHYAATWTMREKRQIGVTVEFPEHIVVDPGGADDVLGLYGLGINSFDGSTGFQFVATTTRFFCLNQLNPALRHARRSFCAKHTTGIKGRVAEAREALGVTLAYAEALDAEANALYQASMTDRQFERLLRDVFPIPSDASDLVKERTTAKRGACVEAWRMPHNANISGTRWGALNVLGEFADWGRKVQGSPRTGTDPVTQRAIGTLVNWPTTFKSRALARLTA